MGDPTQVSRTRDGAKHQNTLVLPKYRIRLELGDIDGLFPRVKTDDSTDPGVRQRLQAVGFLYEPLNSPRINQVAQDAWEHFKKVEGQTQRSAAGAVRHLQQMVRNVIVEQHLLPSPGDFGIVRVPGAYCITEYGTVERASGPTSFRHRQESNVWSANPPLGMIPILAHVEVSRGGKWQPAPAGVVVHFQLLPPDTPPEGHAATSARLRSTPATVTLKPSKKPHGSPTSPTAITMTGSPEDYVSEELFVRNPLAAGDPQGANAHRSVGGRRGHPVAGNNRFQNVFYTGAWPARPDRVGFDPAQASRHAHAVKVSTNLDGDAVVLLMPGWIGGDSYKLRAFLDPVNRSASKGTEKWAVKAETGTLVIWRILRFSKYLRWDYPPGATDAQKTKCLGDLENIDIAGVIAAEYRKAWMDVTVEADAASPQPISHREWVRAIQFAKARVATSLSTLTQTYDLSTLVSETPHPGIIHLLKAAEYDAATKTAAPPKGGPWPSAGADPQYWSNMSRIQRALEEEFVEYFTRSALGGLTVVQAPARSSLLVDYNGAIPATPWRASGKATERRAAFVVFGRDFYTGPGGLAYDLTRNALHETGHLLYRPHQYTDSDDAPTTFGGSTGGLLDEHDYHDLCIMGYMACAGDFCGRCLLSHAGWNVGGMPPNPPGP